MLRKVKLYGELADFVGHKELDAVINSTADAIRFLVTNFPKLEAHMSDKYYKVIVNDEDIGKEELHDPIGKSDISFVPVIAGSGGNYGKVLLGVALIGLSFTPMGAGLFAGGSGAGLAGGGGLMGATGLYAAGAYGSAALGLIGDVKDEEKMAEANKADRNMPYRTKDTDFPKLGEDDVPYENR